MDLLVALNWKDLHALKYPHLWSMQSLQRKSPTSLTVGGIGFCSNFAFVRIFLKILGWLNASGTFLFWEHCFKSLLLIFQDYV